jgi:glutamate dehydrogenase
MFATMNPQVLSFVLEIEKKLKARVSAEAFPSLSAFAKQYFSNVPVDELVGREPADFAESLLSHWASVQTRTLGSPSLKLFNPEKDSSDKTGWTSPHSIIEIVHEDLPFLLDTLVMALNALGINIHLMIYASMRREGTVILSPEMPSTARTVEECVIWLEIDRQNLSKTAKPSRGKEILKVLTKAIQDNQRVTEDFSALKEKTQHLIDGLGVLADKASGSPFLKEDLLESKAFLEWIAEDRFTFLGSADYVLNAKKKTFELEPKSVLGLLKEYESYAEESFLRGGYSATLALKELKPLMITKTSYRSTVHHFSEIMAIRILQVNAAGAVQGESVLFGLYASATYHTNLKYIPILRKKVDQIMDMSGLAPQGHAGKILLNVLENFPRDELFLIGLEELFQIAVGVMQIQERQRVRLFIHRDLYHRYLCCMIYLPRDRYHSDLMSKFQIILMHELSGMDVMIRPNFLESALCRVDFYVRLDVSKPFPEFDLHDLEQQLVLAIRDWKDDFKSALLETYGESQGILFYNRYAQSFPAGYREEFLPAAAVLDVKHIEHALNELPHLSLLLYRMMEESDQSIRLKLFHKGGQIPLTDVLPILENMGLQVIDERPYELHLSKGDSAASACCEKGEHDEKTIVWLSDFGMKMLGSLVTLEEVSENFKTAFLKVWQGDAENDGFNQLIMKAGLNWREVMLFRAYCKYMIQSKFGFSPGYIEQTLQEYPYLVSQLMHYFSVKFNPKPVVKMDVRERELSRLKKEMESSFQAVTSIDKDRIFRRYLELIDATVRTNFYQKDVTGAEKSYLSFKFKCALISDLPKPAPLFEIFMCSSRVEGVHLRGAKVARGGLRWSDRREDYRTEVRDLMKAQQVKNAVIVPLGAKGGFIPLKLAQFQGREAIMAEAIECYKIFIRSLLDLTDNRKGATILPPPDVVRFDEDDTYLVVAADKGTATFSDFANSVAAEYNFWLGDAFASGGSNGYDHKKMGITAKGAWESAKRHFLSLGINIQTQDFTVVGIGDMAGDVFGNGMLLSEHICLIGAFNHQHIFIDPTPEAKRSFKERQRMFNLPRSSWADYDVSCLSKGGAIYERSAKVIEVSPEIQKLLKISSRRLTPSELIQSLLTAKVDMLYNGGIGTYVKASSESHFDVGDRANDALRVNGESLNCRVVVEGGNLGFTQLGRIEFALKGGLINTDFIDNSAGVDCSDHEVNIKIALDTVMAEQNMDREERNALLASMQDEVGHLVLLDNYHHNRTLINGLDNQLDNLFMHHRLLRELEREGFVDRAVEFLPSDKELKARHSAGFGLTTPEYSVLMASSKIAVKAFLLKGSLPDEAYFYRYFKKALPRVLTDTYPDAMRKHPLYREITATQVINMLFRYMGMSFIHRLYDETGANPEMTTRAFVVVKEIFELPLLWDAIEALDGKVPVSVQQEMMHDLERSIRRSTRWILRNRRAGFDIEETIQSYLPKVKQLRELIPAFLSKAERKRLKDYVTLRHANHVPKELAYQVGEFIFLSPVLDIIEAHERYSADLKIVAEIFLKLNDRMGFSWLRTELTALISEGYWGMLGSSALRDDLDKIERLMVGAIHRHTDSELSVEERIEHWRKSFDYMVRRWDVMVEDLKSGQREFVMYVIAIRGLLDLAQSSMFLPQEGR